MMVESALLFGSPPSTTPLELKFGNPKKAGAGKMSLPLEVGIPMESVTMLQVGGKYAADLELRITVMDQNGGRSDTPVSKIEIRGDRPPRPASSSATSPTWGCAARSIAWWWRCGTR